VSVHRNKKQCLWSESGQSRRIRTFATLLGMSAMPPIATQSVRRNEASRRARTGREQVQQTARLFSLSRA